jgi:hypothetical protein
VSGGWWGLGSHSVVDETLGASHQPCFPLMEGGSEDEAAGVAIWNAMGVTSGGWWGLGSCSVVDEMLGASCQPGFPLDCGWKRGRGGWGGHPECRGGWGDEQPFSDR